MDIFCISGLGADARIFSNLELSAHRVRHLPWLTPGKNESLYQYAERMARPVQSRSPIVIGVSFGGMMAIEIAKLINVERIFLVSSIKTKAEMPFYFKFSRALQLNKIVSLRPYKFLAPLENYNLGIHTAEEKQLAAEYRRNLDVQYSDWAIEQVLHWENTAFPNNLVHIHGSSDHIFPIRYVKPHHTIPGGGHMMVMNRADEISNIIHQYIG